MRKIGGENIYMEKGHKFSVVIPVHNEEKYLKYSYSSVVRLYPDEIIVILDRCFDKSKEVIEKIHEKYNDDISLFFITISSKSSWKMHVAYLRRLAYKKTRNNIILNTSADLVLDIRIKTLIKCLKRNIKLINLGFLDYPYNIKCFLRKIYSEFTPIKGYSGLIIFDKNAWEETENQEEIKNISSSEDTFLQLAIKSKYKTLHVNTNTFHLRPTESKVYQQKRGKNYYQLLNASMLKIFLMSFFMLRPYMFSSYMREREEKYKIVT